MDDMLITMQETLSHQADEIARLGEELYAQQKEIAALRARILQLETKTTDEGVHRKPEDETPPPHY